MFYYLLQQTNASHIVEIVNLEDGEEAVTLPILLIELIASQLHLALIKKWGNSKFLVLLVTELWTNGWNGCSRDVIQETHLPPRRQLWKINLWVVPSWLYGGYHIAMLNFILSVKGVTSHLSIFRRQDRKIIPEWNSPQTVHGNPMDSHRLP